MHYQQVISAPRYEDFEISYVHKNPWAHLGMGYTLENRLGIGNADQSPYMSVDNIDPKWLEAVGSKKPEDAGEQKPTTA